MKAWKEVYCEVLSEVRAETWQVWSSVSPHFSAELSKRIHERYEPVDVDGRRLYQFRAPQ